MRELGIDLETYCDIPLKTHGLHRYVSHPSFEIMLFGYAFDNDDPTIVDLANGGDVPQEVINALTDAEVKKTAWNAQFEMNALNQYIEFETVLEQWECTMVKASMLGYPADLDQAGRVMGLETTKDRAGKALVKYFTVPNKPTKTNPNVRFRNRPQDDWSRWSGFKEYNAFDVKVEQLAKQKIKFFTIPKREKTFWFLDQKINSRGVKIDRKLVKNALSINKIINDRLFEEATQITGLKNANSPAQLKEWLTEQTGTTVDKLTKDSIPILLEDHSEEKVQRLLKIRQQMSKSSTKKYLPMFLCSSPKDDRARGLFRFYGANKTGRWGASLIQPHNLVRNKMKDLDLARRLVLENRLDDLELLFGNVPNVMSQLCRTAFIAEPNHDLLGSDFSAIEARGTAWFADETWRIKVFEGKGKIYEASGAQMFKIDESLVVGSIRDKSKVAELALGYQGGVGALARMGALQMGLKDEELQPLVDLWRAVNKNIVKLWYTVDKAAIQAVENPGQVIGAAKCKFFVRHETLFIQLPSGRFLTYVKPHLRMNKFEKMAIHFYGVDQITKKWCRQQTYGGKLVENIVQGFSRDLLAEKMVKLDEAGFDIVMHVHDEIVAEIERSRRKELVDQVNSIMRKPISWAPGLPLSAETFTTPYYIKA